MNSLRKLAGDPIVWLLVAALAARLGAAVWWQSRLPADRQFEFGDSESYWVLAQSIVRGEPYDYGDPPRHVFRTPGYPIALAGMMLVVGPNAPVMWARALGAVFGTLTVLLLYILGLQLFDRTTGRVAALFAAFYPGAIGLSVFVLSEALFCPLMVAQLVTSAAAWKSVTSRAAILFALAAGGLAGAATLARPSWLLFTPLSAVLLLLGQGQSIARRGLLVTALGAGMLFTMAPWWIRNAHVSGHFIPTTLQVGASLYDGWNPQADGSSNMKPVDEFIAQAAPQLPADPAEREYQLDRDLHAAAVDWARANPGRAASLAVVKLTRLWNVWPNESGFRSWPMRLAVLAPYVPLVALAILGAWKFSRRGWPWMLCWAPALYISLLHIVFVSSIRYREPVMLPLMVLAAAAMLQVFRVPTPTRSASEGGTAADPR
jgi:4-amino-4-deoxy-L-arabinose transferase-like glycosyltransferase